jgi:hypothetical protein
MHVRLDSEAVTVTRQVYGRVSSLTVSKGLLRACEAQKDVGEVSVAMTAFQSCQQVQAYRIK